MTDLLQAHAVADAERYLELARGVLDIEADAVRALKARLGEAFLRAHRLMLGTRGRVVVTGMGKSGHIARKIASTLASTGTPAFFMHPGEASHGDLGMITEEDVVVAISYSGESDEILKVLPLIKRRGAPVIAITGRPRSTLAVEADVHLDAAVEKEACPLNLAPTASTTATLALGDALAIALLEGRGFTSVEFAHFHPGGKLGAMLKFVRDIMHTGTAIPTRPLGARMSDAVVEMSSKGFGCVCIVDRNGDIAGIITDGDLRRHMRPDLLTATVDEVMTRNPRTIAPGMLATEVLDTINSSKPAVTVLIVAEGRKPVGIVHVHDVLRAGVA